jgi:Lysozyme like domain
VNLAQLQQLAADNGFPDPALAAAVAMAESGGNPNAYNTEGSYGLWQIDVVYHPQYQSDPSVLFDPTTNAQAAFQISSGGTNWNPWTTFRCPCTGCGTSGPACYLQWYTPTPVPTSGPQPAVASTLTPANVILVSAGLVGIGLATWAGYREVQRRRFMRYV